jgi:hypothetical protein
LCLIGFILIGTKPITKLFKDLKKKIVLLCFKTSIKNKTSNPWVRRFKNSCSVSAVKIKFFIKRRGLGKNAVCGNGL